jgi:hypothetical protein
MNSSKSRPRERTSERLQASCCGDRVVNKESLSCEFNFDRKGDLKCVDTLF